MSYSSSATGVTFGGGGYKNDTQGKQVQAGCICKHPLDSIRPLPGGGGELKKFSCILKFDP